MRRARSFVIVCAFGLAACAGSAVPEDVPELDLTGDPVADAPDPADRAGASARFVDCEYGIWNGGWSVDFGPAGEPSNSPEGALDALVESGLFGLPHDGYLMTGRDEGRVLFTYPASGAPKVAVIVGDTDSGVELGATGGWMAETFAACDPAEYDPSDDAELGADVWTDVGGNRVPTTVITSFTGSAHCNWESVTFLRVGNRQYIADPRGLIDVPWTAPYSDDATLPAGAHDSGYRHDGRALWLSADKTIAYVLTDDTVEVWPSPLSDEPIACA